MLLTVLRQKGVGRSKATIAIYTVCPLHQVPHPVAEELGREAFRAASTSRADFLPA